MLANWKERAYLQPSSSQRSKRGWPSCPVLTERLRPEAALALLGRLDVEIAGSRNEE
jgi:hypothetical protein